MELIPLQRLYEEAETILEDQGGEGTLEDLVIQRLLHWFKNEFFKWVNNAPCDYCHNVSTVYFIESIRIRYLIFFFRHKLVE
jgi:peptide-N4-(N-acetyl-beta-glucosaminyl)asparagine amidase